MTKPGEFAEYAPHRRQSEFHDDPRPYRWFCAGYGAGKSKALVVEALVNATVHHPGYAGIVAAPTYKLLFQAWFQAWREFVPRSCWELKRDPLFGPHLLVANASGKPSTIWLRSTSNPWSNEGINAAWLVFDEAPRERNRDAFGVLQGRLRAGYPGRQRTIAIAGPPQTRRHWTALEWGTGPDASRGGTISHWHSRTHAVVRCRTEDNPHLPPTYVRDLRERPGATRAWVAQWMHASFGAVEGQVYDAWDRDVHVVPARNLVGRHWRKVRVGCDWGWTKPGTMMVVAEGGDHGDLFVLFEEVHTHKQVADVPDGWIPIAQRLCDGWRPDLFLGDPSAPGNVAAVGKGVRGRARAVGGNNDLGEGIRRVAARLEGAVARARDPRSRAPALYVSDACPHAIEEFESWARMKERDGSFSEQPEDGNDHALDGIRYAVMSLTRS